MAYNVLQSVGANNGSANPSATYTSNLTAGTKLLAFASNSGGSGSPGVSAVGDGAGHNFTLLQSFPMGDSPAGAAGLWVLDTPAALVGTKPTITATCGNAANGTAIVIAEVSGLAPGTTTAACFDGTASTDNGNQTTAGAFTPGFTAYTSHAVGEFLIAAYMDGGDNGSTATAPGAPYTALAGNQTGNSSSNGVIVWKSSTGGSESQGTWSDTFTSGNLGWATLFVAFKLATGASETPLYQGGQAWQRRQRLLHPPPPEPPAFPNPYAIGAPAITGSPLTLPTSTAPGDAVVVLANTTNAVTSVSDTQGNTYLLVCADVPNQLYLYTATYHGQPGTPTVALKANVDTITIGNATGGVATIAGVRGAAPWPYAATAPENTNTSTTPSGPTIGPFQTVSEVVLAFYSAGINGYVTAWASPWFRVADGHTGGGATGIGALFLTSTAAVTPSATLGNSVAWKGMAVSLYLNPYVPYYLTSSERVAQRAPPPRPPRGYRQSFTTAAGPPVNPAISQTAPERAPAFPGVLAASQLRRLRGSQAGPATTGISQPPIPPTSIRDTRREPREPPPRSSETPWQGSGISQPPIPPQGLRDARRPKLPPRGSAGGGGLQGISQPPIPPSAVHAWRRPLRFPRPWSWAPPAPKPPPAVPPARQPLQQPGRWAPGRWRRSAAAGPATSGVSQPPIPPSALRDTRRPWLRKGAAASPPPAQVVITPAAPVPGQPGQQGRRRPVRFPRPWSAGPPSPGFTPGAAVRQPQPAMLRRISAGLLPRRGSVRPGFEQGISQPPVPPQAVRDTRKPPRVFRSVAGWARGASQPPIPPASVRDVRRPPRVPRSAAGWQQGISQPPAPPQGVTGRRPKLTPPRPRAAAPWTTRGAPVPSPGPRRQAVRRRLSAAFTPGTAPPAIPAAPAPRQPRAWQRLGWWRKVRGWLGTPPGPTTTPPLLPSGTVTWQASTAPPRWQAQPVPSGWETVATPPRWQAGAGTLRWQAAGLPGRWSAALVLPSPFSPVSSLSLEEINVSWTSELRGTEIDPTGQTTGQPVLPVQFAFPVSSGSAQAPAQPSVWYNGAWMTGQTSVDFIAQCLVGPSGGVTTLTSGTKYDVWCKIAGTPETPVKFVGTLAVY